MFHAPVRSHSSAVRKREFRDGDLASPAQRVRSRSRVKTGRGTPRKPSSEDRIAAQGAPRRRPLWKAYAELRPDSLDVGDSRVPIVTPTLPVLGCVNHKELSHARSR
jgi:hypothetical protein